MDNCPFMDDFASKTLIWVPESIYYYVIVNHYDPIMEPLLTMM